MNCLKRRLWKLSIIGYVGLLWLALLPLSVAKAHERVLTLSMPVIVTVQATPTVDATVTVLEKEQLQHEDDWWWNYGATVLTSLISTFTLAAAGIFTVVRYFNDRRDGREKQETETNRVVDDRKAELEKRAEERFQTTVTGLGDDKEGTRIGAAILLRTFLRPGHGQFYTQTFDLVVAHLRLPRTPVTSTDANVPQPLTTLTQALIVAFKESFPLARNELEERLQLSNKQNSPFNPQLLDATGIQLDNAYLRGADLKQVWMPQASLRKVDLIRANLNGANLKEANLQEADLNGVDFRDADLRGADLTGADLKGADLKGARLRRANLKDVKLRKAGLKSASLKKVDLTGADLSEATLSGTDLVWTSPETVLALENTNLRGVNGLTLAQLVACKANGAIIDEAPAVSVPEPAVIPLQLSQHDTVQPSPPPLVQEVAHETHSEVE